jgi:hypothetical protein
MQGKRGLYVVDWEWAEEAPIFVDAARLGSQIKDFAAHFLAAVDSYQKTQQTNLLDSRYQFAIAILFNGCRRMARQHDFISARDKAAYRKRLRQKIRRLVALMDRVLLQIPQQN